MARKYISLILVAVPYLLLAFFVLWVINPLCYNIFQQPAFVVTTDFFWSKVNMPGGLAEYLQTFIDQFTMFPFWGTLFLVAELLLTAFLIARYVRKIVADNQYVNLLAYILPVAVAFVAWTDVKFAFAINMQMLLLAAVLNLQQALSKFDWHKYLTPLLAIAVYHACGPVALYTFALCCIIACALNSDKREIVSVVGAVAVAALWPLIVYKFILPITPSAAFYDMRPQNLMFVSFANTIVPYFFFICVPALMVIGYAYNFIHTEKNTIIITAAGVAVIAAGTVFFQHKHDNFVERVGYKMEVAAQNKEWNEIIKLIDGNKQLYDVSNYDRTINFYYDNALAETDRLFDRMFYYPQILGDKGLFLDKPMATNIGYPVARFYYNMGFVTSALHFAFEAQSTYTNSHYVLKMIIDCLIIIGDYTTAEKFLDKYEHNMFSGKFVADRRGFIKGNPSVDLSVSFVSQVRRNHPHNDFYMQSRQNNMLQVLLTDNSNRLASQYLLGSALLECDLDLFVRLLVNGYYNVSNNNLPRGCQEAVLLYKAMGKDVNPEIEKFKIQPYVESKFVDFMRITKAKPNNLKQLIEKNFSNTYWKYYFIDSPRVTGASL